MTRKDYIALARALSDARYTINKKIQNSVCNSVQPEDMWRMTVSYIADVLAADNPRFDGSRFYEACGIQEEAS